MKHLLATAFSTAVLVSPAAADIGETASASFVDRAGEVVGRGVLTQTNAGVLIELEVATLPAERWIAFHIHEGGVCDAENDHEAAGDHFSPSGAAHGFLAQEGPHEGDMPNQYVPADGILRAQVLKAGVTLTDGEADIRGRTLLLHAEPDDHESQPAGGAGDRIACAVIE